MKRIKQEAKALFFVVEYYSHDIEEDECKRKGKKKSKTGAQLAWIGLVSIK